MIDQSTIRWMRRQRAHGFLAVEAIDINSDVYELAEEAVEADDVPEHYLATYREHGFITCRDAAAIGNWIADLPIDVPTFSRKVHRCQRCHRELTDPESIALGYGPECAAAAGITAA